MTDIPEDVMNLAREMVRKHRDAYHAVQDETSDTHQWAAVDDMHAEDIARAILADRAAQAERMARLEEALRHVRSATYYPVSTEINPRGWAWHMGPDGQEFVVETIEAALNFHPARALSQEGSDA